MKAPQPLVGTPRRQWWSEVTRLRQQHNLTPPPSDQPAIRRSSDHPIEVELAKNAKPVVMPKRISSPSTISTRTNTTNTAVPKEPLPKASLPKTVMTVKSSKTKQKEEPSSSGLWLGPRLSRTSKPQQQRPIQPTVPSSLPPSPPPPAQPLQRESTFTSAASSNRPSLILSSSGPLPQFLNIEEVLQEMPPPALMDDATSVASASSSTITSIDRRVNRSYEDDYEDEDEELQFVANGGEPLMLDDPALQKGWWERLWEMVDPDTEDKTIVTFITEPESPPRRAIATDESLDETAPMTPESSPGKGIWWRRARQLQQQQQQADGDPIRPPSRGVIEEDSSLDMSFLEAFPEEALQTESPKPEKVSDTNRNTASERGLGSFFNCPLCNFGNGNANPSNSQTELNNEARDEEPTDDEEPVEKEEEYTDMFSDHLSVVLSKFDRSLLPWICQYDGASVTVASEIDVGADAKEELYPPNPDRKVRFASTVQVNEDDDEIRERVDQGEGNEGFEIKESFPPTTFARFLDWLAAIEVKGASLSDSNDALCQPISDKSDEPETPTKPIFSFSIDPKIPQEISMLSCNFDEVTVLTLDPAFHTCSTTSTTVEEPKPISKSFFRRNGKVLPVLSPPFLRKAPVNKEREKQELEIARAMWRHYKKTKDIEDTINTIRAAERQKQREEWAAAVAAHRKLRRCNHINCNCHQEQW